jgi:hypothetical protein
MQDIHFCDGSVRPATNPGELLPAVQKTTN